MGKSKRRGINPPLVLKNRRIPESATVLKESILHLRPYFSFEHLCESYFQLDELTKENLKELKRFLKRISSMSWNQIYNSKGIDITKIPRERLSKPIPASVPDDSDIIEMSVSDSHRIWGFQHEQVIYVIWFDPNHQVLPEGKKR